MSSSPKSPLAAHASSNIKGVVNVPGDKSTSHRALMLGAFAEGETTIDGLLESEDVHATAMAMAALGAHVEREQSGRWRVQGCGARGFKSPVQEIDFGNAGTGVRLCIGLAASSDITARFTGDASLSKRPMGRVITPLERMGARFSADEGGTLPLTLYGAAHGTPITYELPMPSAQVKSAVLLAGLNVSGETTVLEPVPTRDHTERMLEAFGADLEISESKGARRITLKGPAQLKGQHINVPADPSSAGFPIVAALITEGSELELPGVMMNPTRAGLIHVLRDMGGDITLNNERVESGEQVADLVVRSSKLKGITVPPDVAPSMIDEYPVLAVAAACAEGVTEMLGIGEMRVKESDRVEAVAAGLRANGVEVETGDDWMKVTGSATPPGGGMVETHLDHRIAMSFLVLGFVSEAPVVVDDGAVIATSFPGFTELMESLGARIESEIA